MVMVVMVMTILLIIFRSVAAALHVVRRTDHLTIVKVRVLAWRGLCRCFG